MLALQPGFRVGNRAYYSANAREWIVLEFFEQPFAPDFGLQYDLGTGSV